MGTGDWETRGQGDKETRGQGDKETRRQGDKGTRRQGEILEPNAQCSMPIAHCPIFMNEVFSLNFTHTLQNLMQRVGVSSFKALSETAGVSERQILRLRRGEVMQMRVDVLLKLSQVLQMPLSELITSFSQVELVKETGSNQELLQEITNLKIEYQRSLVQLEQQREVLLCEFQQTSLQLLESLLLQFPTAAQKAQENPQLPAVKILPLVQKPLEKLLQQWKVEAIAPVGAELSYDPQIHQLMEGTAQPGEKVKIRYTGYRQGDKLLYRAKVSLV